MNEIVDSSLENSRVEKEIIDADYSTWEETSKKTAKTQGEIDQKMIALLVLLNKQIAEQRRAQAIRNETEATLQKYRSYDENSQRLRRIGTVHD